MTALQNTKIRTRIAPSPTSKDKTLHLGNVRTALFSYLLSKKSGGDFILRIEDSDVARNVSGCSEGMFDDLVWLGIPPNEGFGTDNKPFGPYSQLEKIPRYRAMAEDLISRGLAYKCVCSEEMLNKQRDEAFEKNPKAPFRYPGTCRDLRHDPDKNYVVRFKAPIEGETIHNDLVFGRIRYPHIENYDWVILRASGIPLYNFSVFVDDLDMQITHVVRGRDHSGPNTLAQLLFYKAFDATPPKFAHLPMVNNQEGNKLSKRDGAVSAKEFQSLGYSPSAILNYIARLGWSSGNKELFSHNELVELFNVSNCGRNDARFDPKKFAAIQYEHLKKEDLTSTEEYAYRVLPFLAARGLEHFDQKRVESAIHMIRHKCKSFIEAANELDPIFRNNIAMDTEAANKFITSDTKPILNGYANYLSNIDNWDETCLKESTQKWLDQNGILLKDISQSIRVSIFGRSNSPDLFKVMAVLGKTTTINRIAKNV